MLADHQGVSNCQLRFRGTDDRLLSPLWSKDPDNSDIAVKCGATDAFVPVRPLKFPEKSHEITLATWNVSGLSTDTVNNQFTENERIKAEWIKDHKPDILGLQEVEDLYALNRFRKKFLERESYPYRIVVKSSNRCSNVGLLSEFPLVKVFTYRGAKFNRSANASIDQGWFTHPPLEACVQITPKIQMRLFVTHFKAHRDQESFLQRIAESLQISKIVREHLKSNLNGLLAVIGDCNCTPDYPPVRLLRRAPTYLMDPLACEGKGNEPTYRSTRYDYILFSLSLMEYVVPGSAKVIHFNKKGLSSEQDPHDPVVVKLKFG